MTARQPIASSNMKRVALVTLALLSLAPFVQSAHAAGVEVRNAWARATAPGQSTASIYMDIVSADGAVLVGVKSAVAKRAEVHASSMQDGVMRMRAVEKIELPAKKTVSLTPGGQHVMLIGIVRALRESEKVPLELVLESAGGARSSLRVDATVRAAGAAAHPHAH